MALAYFNILILELKIYFNQFSKLLVVENVTYGDLTRQSCPSYFGQRRQSLSYPIGSASGPPHPDSELDQVLINRRSINEQKFNIP